MRKSTQEACALHRRGLLQIGALSALGLGLGELFHRQRTLAAKPALAHEPKAKACILIWLDGGPSHMETFDPKPNAPEEVRGPFQSIATNVPGVRINECLERTAGIMDQLTLVRSVTSPLGEHNFGTHYMMTGYKPSPALQYPSFGATLSHLQATANSTPNTPRENRANVLPPHIAVPSWSRNISANGYLPKSTAAFSVGGNPDRADFQVRDLDFYDGLNLARLDRRRDMVQAMNAFSSNEPSADSAVDPDLERAYALVASADAKQAFALAEEPDSLRQQYGRGGGNGIGQSCLLARRLVERGVPFVTVNSRGWDTHQNLVQLKRRYPNDRNAHLPSLDRALSALVTDLSDRGMLDETLVVVMGEFGRTPKVNSNGGRDHWPKVFSVALAGGGVPGGQVIGASDALGELPRDRPVTPSDLSATIYSLLGVDPTSELHTSDGRPIRIAPDGAQVIPELMG